MAGQNFRYEQYGHKSNGGEVKEAVVLKSLSIASLI